MNIAAKYDRLVYNFFILKKSNEKAGKSGIQKYWKENNAKSLDGILTNIEKKNIERS